MLFVSAYLDDAIALRRQIVEQHVHLLANIGTSSSYCMPAFGETLGKEAVGVYASDKPSATSIEPRRACRPAGQALLARADAAYKARWGHGHEPARRSPGSRGPGRCSPTCSRVAVARPGAPWPTPRATVDLPRGSLPNGSGLRFGASGTPDAGDNLAAASVIWEVGLPRTRRRDLAAGLRDGAMPERVDAW